MAKPEDSVAVSKPGRLCSVAVAGATTWGYTFVVFMIKYFGFRNVVLGGEADRAAWREVK